MTEETTIQRSSPYLFLISIIVLLIHFYNNYFTTFGLFRDELYYIACSNNLAIGYVDQPPFCALVLWMSRQLFGESVFAIRIIPSAAHAITVFLSGMIARKAGGQTYAQILSAISVAVAPGIIGIFGIYSMNAIDILLWMIVYYLLIRMFETQKPMYWIWIGIVIGLGLMNKISMGWLGMGVFTGIFFTAEWNRLKTIHPWVGAAAALLIFTPYIIWNVQNDFAHLEFAGNASRLKYASQNPITFVSGFALLYGPLIIPVWLSGFFVLLKHKEKSFRLLGFAVLTVFAILLINIHSKTEYFNPAAVLLLAAGSVQIEKWFSSGRRKRMIRYFYLGLIVIFGIMTMPMAIDILPVRTFISYSRMIGISPPSSEGHRMSDLPQHFADRFGWKELASTVAGVYRSLPDDEKKFALIYSENYGEAGAIDFYGKEYGLPKAISGHNNYWIWSKDRISDSLTVGIIIGGEADDHRDTFEEVTLAALHTSQYAMEYENQLKIFICRKPKVKIRDVWHLTRRYI